MKNKLITSAFELSKAIDKINKVKKSKNTLPVLDNYLVTVNEKETSITGSDLENTLTVKLKTENYKEDFKFLLTFDSIALIKKLDKTPISIEYDNETCNIDIFTENGKYSYQTEEWENFPQFNFDKVINSFELDFEDLHTGINKTLWSVSIDELRPILTGVNIKSENNVLKICGTDGNTLSVYTKEVEDSIFDSVSIPDFNIILNPKISKIITGYKTKDFHSVKFEIVEREFESYSSKQSEKHIDTVRLYLHNEIFESRLIEGKFVNYDAVIPDYTNYSVSINKKDILKSLERLSLVANQASDMVKINREDNKLLLSAQDLDFNRSGLESVYCEYENVFEECAFKSERLQKSIKQTESDNIKFDFTQPNNGMCIREKNLLIMVMPFNLDKM